MAGMKKTRRPQWKTEEQICDHLELHADEFFGLEENERLFREFNLGGPRADFAIISPRKIKIIEVKITADIWSLDQLSKYICLMNERALWWCAENRDQTGFEVTGELWARWIDESVWPIARVARISVSRLVIEEEGQVDLSIEPFPIFRSDLPEDISQVLSSISGGSWQE